MTCRKGREFLAQTGAEADERDFFVDRLTRDELVAILDGRPASEIFSFKSPTAKSLGVAPGSRSDDELLDLMASEPRLMRRPILKVGNELLVGFAAKQWEAALK